MSEFIHPYQEAYDLEWDNDYNGWLTAEEMQARKQEWVDYINMARPLVYSAYKQMVDAQKKEYKRRVTIWVKIGGLKVVQMGETYNAFYRIANKYERIAANRAMEARKAAGWSGPNYLTDPSGNRGPSRGKLYGPFARPEAQFEDKGMWDGYLKKEPPFTEFTV